MLLNKIDYADDFPINIRVLTIKNVPLHFHSDIEFVFVLRGSISLTSGYCGYVLKTGDVFTNNGHEIHSLSSDDPDNIVAVLQISNGFFTKYFPTLGKSAYRTYSISESSGRLDDLRRMLLRVLIHYLRKSLNFKNQCINETIDLIRYMNKYFNLFTLNDRVVVTVEDDNPLTLERLSRIISYIYDNYRTKVTLENISELEHLSIFYLSHLIKEYTGMSFRDFLCFVRVERSEIELLDTDKKISRIAKEVGFSTTAYYRKFFEHWYGRSPEEHRRIYQPLVMGPLNPEKAEDCSASAAINTITSLMYGLDIDTGSGAVTRGSVDITIDADAESLGKPRKHLSVIITDEDREALGALCEATLDDLRASEIRVRESKSAGLPVYGWDTVAAPIHVIRSNIREENLSVALRDQGSIFPLFKGRPSLLTSGGIRKPVYFAYYMLVHCGGDIISLGDYHIAIRRKEEGRALSFYLLCFNYDDRIDKLCTLSTSIHEAAEILGDFRDSLDLNLNIRLPVGKYALMRYAMGAENTLFNYMKEFGFPRQKALEKGELPDDLLLKHAAMLNTSPQSYITRSVTKGVSSVNFSIKGPGLELVVLQKLD